MVKKFITERSKKSVFVLFAIYLCLPITAKTQTLNLYDAVINTITNYPLLKQRVAEIKTAKAHEQTIAGNRLPSLILQNQLDMGTVNSLPGSYFPLGIIPSVSGGNSVTNKSQMNVGDIAISFLQWEFYNFGYVNAQQNEAIANTELYKAILEKDTYLLTLNVVAQYLDWQKKYNLLHIEINNLSRAKLIYSSIKANVLSGLKPGVDTSTAKAAYSGARLSYLKALDDYNTAKISLFSYTGIKNDLLLPDTNSINKLLLNELVTFKQEDSISLSHPLLNVYLKKVDMEFANNKVLSKKYLPHFAFTGAAFLRGTGISPTGNYSTDMNMPYNRYNYLMGLSISYNIFDIKHRKDQLLEGKYTIEAMQEELKTQTLSLNTMLQQATSSYNITLEKLTEIPIQQQAATDAYNQQLALYRSGLNTIIDITNAQYILMQAETNYAIAQNDLIMLLFIRAGLNGQSDKFLQKFKQ